MPTAHHSNYKLFVFYDPRISRMDKTRLQFCPKYLDLYASIYGIWFSICFYWFVLIFYWLSLFTVFLSIRGPLASMQIMRDQKNMLLSKKKKIQKKRVKNCFRTIDIKATRCYHLNFIFGHADTSHCKQIIHDFFYKHLIIILFRYF